jgi:hypothetical protein
MIIKYFKQLKAGYIYRKLDKIFLMPFKRERIDPTRFGKNSYCVLTKMSKHRIYINADKIILDNGALKFTGAYEYEEDELSNLIQHPTNDNLIIAPGMWKAVYLLYHCQSAAIEMWEGEVDKYHG